MYIFWFDAVFVQLSGKTKHWKLKNFRHKILLKVGFDISAIYSYRDTKLECKTVHMKLIFFLLQYFAISISVFSVWYYFSSSQPGVVLPDIPPIQEKHMSSGDRVLWSTSWFCHLLAGFLWIS